MIPGVHVGGPKIEYRLSLSPGVTDLGLYPEFNVADLNEFARGCRRRGITCESLGRSREGRDILMVTVPPFSADARPFFIQARDHAYETAGSYCAAGIADFLTGGSALAAYLRSKFRVMLVPISNVDGVYNGMSRLTWEKGADLCRVSTRPDPSHDAIKAALDRIKPAVYINIHNWTYKLIDGLMPLDASLAERIAAHMPADSAHFKRWKIRTLADDYKRMGLDKLSPEKARKKHRGNWLWKHYLNDKYGTVSTAFEFPWFSLNTADMRAKGARAFIATALAAIEEKSW